MTLIILHFVRCPVNIVVRN